MIKWFKNNLVDYQFRRARPAGYQQFIQDLRGRTGPNVCFTIAFNTPWVIDLQIRFWRRNVGDTTLVVIDNSSKPEARRQLEELCRKNGVFYLGLPKNREWNPNRSHGISMNWIYYNIVKRLEPEKFGFIDHDCFPIAPFSLDAKIGTAKAYGFKRLVNRNGVRWNLWAGLTFMRFDAVRDLKLDFKSRPELGLDTGGGNWPVFYSRIAEDELAIATQAEVSPRVYRDVELRLHHLDDCFFHVGGASHKEQTLREQYSTRIREYLEETYLAEEPLKH